MNRAVEALAAERELLLRIGSSLDSRAWDQPSGCGGWTTKDVVSHLGALFWAAVDPSVLPDVTGMATEEAQEVSVAFRRGMSGPQVLDDYASVSEQALAVLDSIAEVDDEMALGDLGTYPARILPTAFCFDHYTHIRADLFTPRGSLPGPIPPSDTLRLTPALDWIEAAVAQQNHVLLESNGFEAADIMIWGTAARTIRLGGSTGPASATVRSDADTLVRWITQRGDWPSLGVDGEGDPATLALLQRLKVF
jgi:uncharacterized protein (TIGR03083 family)